MVFYGLADLRHQGGHEAAAALEVTALGVEYALEFLHQESGVTPFAKYRGNHPGKRHHPLEMIHVLGIDEDLEGPALFVFRTLVEHDVVDGDVQGVLRQRGFYLVGGAHQDLRSLQFFMHVLHGGGGGLDGLRLAGHAAVHDLLVYPDCHSRSLPAYSLP